MTVHFFRRLTQTIAGLTLLAGVSLADESKPSAASG